jgi:antitoxin component YwqK of YwqJK toxin-antitoxin module
MKMEIKIESFFEIKEQNDYYNTTNKKSCQEGTYEEFFENGKKHIECQYSFDKKEGKYLKYYESSGKIKIECYYKKGILHGKYIEYFENGNKKIECEYENYKKVGLYEEFYENGKLKNKSNI